MSSESAIKQKMGQVNEDLMKTPTPTMIIWLGGFIAGLAWVLDNIAFPPKEAKSGD